MKFSILIGLFLCLASAAKTDWIPVFDDQPVTPEESSLIDSALPEVSVVTPQEKRRVLIYSATAGFRHKSIPVGKVALSQLGESTGAYTTVVSDDPSNFEPDALKAFDTVILLSPTQDFFMPNGRLREQFTAAEWKWLKGRHDRLIDNLIRFVEQGGGLVGIHAATDACYGNPEYAETMGGVFNGHPWMAGQNVTIHIEDPTHAVVRPVFEGMQDFAIQDEIYQFRDEPYSRERLRVLLRLDVSRSDAPKGDLRREDNDYPVCWVQKVGAGRIFYSSLGHNKHIYWNPLILKHYLAGIQFACGDLPADTTPSDLLGSLHLIEQYTCCP